MNESRLNRLASLRRTLKLLHPEGIPWPAAVLYDRISATSVFQDQYERVARHIINYCSHGSLLDIGTGPGRLLMKLHDASPTMRLVGVDISPAMVKRARKNVESSGLPIEIRESGAASLPFRDGAFDIVVSTGTIHHWKDPSGALNEIYRVLKGGRYALMYDVVRDTPPHVLQQMHRQFGKLRTTFFWIHAFEEPFLSLDGFQRLAEATLFERGDTHFVGMFCCLVLKKMIPDIIA